MLKCDEACKRLQKRIDCSPLDVTHTAIGSTYQTMQSGSGINSFADPTIDPLLAAQQSKFSSSSPLDFNRDTEQAIDVNATMEYNRGQLDALIDDIDADEDEDMGDEDEDEGEGAGQEDLEDDVTAVGGDILGVGPTLGLVGDDPTSNLGPLGHDMTAALLAPQGGTQESPSTSGTSADAAAAGEGRWGGSAGYHAVDKGDFGFGSIAEGAYTDAGLGLGHREEATTEEPKYLTEAAAGASPGGGEPSTTAAAAVQDVEGGDGLVAGGSGGLAEGGVLFSEGNAGPVVVDAVVPAGAGTVGVPTNSQDQRHLQAIFGQEGE